MVLVNANTVVKTLYLFGTYIFIPKYLKMCKYKYAYYCIQLQKQLFNLTYKNTAQNKNNRNFKFLSHKKVNISIV